MSLASTGEAALAAQARERRASRRIGEKLDALLVKRRWQIKQRFKACSVSLVVVPR